MEQIGGGNHIVGEVGSFGPLRACEKVVSWAEIEESVQTLELFAQWGVRMW